MRKFSTEKNALTISAVNTTQKNERHDENFKNQNIMLKKKDIIDILICKTQKRQKCAFNHNAQILK